jgi:hypothetical protein
MAERDVGDVSSAETATRADRRRPGRVGYKNPHLVGLLRDAGSEAHASEAADEPEAMAAAEASVDGLAPARGLLLGSLIGSLAWIAIGLAIWLLF